MMRTDRLRRLSRLEALQPGCRTCGNHPTRIVEIDGDRDEVLSETMPETGCPTCGRPVWRTIQIVGTDVTRI